VKEFLDDLLGGDPEDINSKLKNLFDERTKFAESLAYENRYTAFLDVLGWSNVIEESVYTPEIVKRLGQVSNNRFEDELSIHTSSVLHPEADLQIIQFSDCIVISTRVCKDGFKVLMKEVWRVVLLRSVMGLYVRGGITIGKLIHQDSVVFGPSLIRAYHLESDKGQAVFPRIISDNEVDLSTMTVDGLPTWRLDVDGKYFFDFLNHMPWTDYNSRGALEYLESQRATIAIALRRFRKEERILEKYVWLRDYFNLIVEERKVEIGLIQ